MKNYFIINPNAGRKRRKAELLSRIERAAATPMRYSDFSAAAVMVL